MTEVTTFTWSLNFAMVLGYIGLAMGAPLWALVLVMLATWFVLYDFADA